LLRWTLTATILIFLSDRPAFQILFLLILSIIWQFLLLVAKPFDRKIINIISFYNEVAVSAYLYTAFLLSDYLETQLREEKSVISNLRLDFAWILTGILMLTIFINIVFTLVSIGISAINYFKRKIKDNTN
jgi:hypothetical protein